MLISSFSGVATIKSSLPSYFSKINKIMLAKSSTYINCLKGLPVPLTTNGLLNFLDK